MSEAAMTAPGLLQRVILILVRMSADQATEAESLLEQLAEAVKRMSADEREPLQEKLDLCGKLARRANEFWERQRASLLAAETASQQSAPIGWQG